MKEQLKRHVDLLFTSASDAEDIKQEILQNTMDRYDDLITQGKTPQAAYQLAIAGIGDISEILNCEVTQAPPNPYQPETVLPSRPVKSAWKKALQAIGICLYIMCPIPLFVLQNAVGLCGLLTFVAVATALMVISGGKGSSPVQSKQNEASSHKELRKAVRATVSVIGICAYFVLSFSTQAWYITWVIFPLIGAVQGLIIACMDLKEAGKNEA